MFNKFDFNAKTRSGNISFLIQLAEMVRIIGFHIPNTCDKWRQFLVKKFDLNEKTKSGNYQPFTYHWSLYTRLLIQVSISIKNRTLYISKIFWNSEMSLFIYSINLKMFRRRTKKSKKDILSRILPERVTSQVS